MTKVYTIIAFYVLLLGSLTLGCNQSENIQEAGYKIELLVIKVKNTTTKSAEISWEKPVDATGYIVSLWEDKQMKIPVDRYTYIKVDSSIGGYVFKGLVGGYTYYSAVKSVQSFGESVYSHPVQIDVELSFPEKPYLQPVGSTSVLLNWDEVSGITEYNYLVATDPNFVGLIEDAGTSDRPVIIKKLTPNTQYYIKLRSVRGERLSSFSDYAVVVTGYPDLKIHSATRITKTSADVSWDLVPNVERYEVVYSDDSEFKVAQTRLTVTHSFELTGLKKATTYWVKIRCKSTYGTYSEYSGVSSFRTQSDAKLSGVPGFAVSEIKANQFTVSWTFPLGIDGYEISLSKSEDFNSKSVVQDYDNYFTSSTDYTFSNLESGARYFVRVRSKKENVVSTYSNISEVETLHI